MNIDKRIQFAIEHYQAGNLHQAERIFREILKVQPNIDDSYYYLGNILQDKEQVDEAVICYQKAINLNPNSAGSYYNLGAILHKKGRYSEAIACYQKVLQLKPDLADTYNNLGTIFQTINQLDEAITYYQKAIHIDPNYDKAFHNAGIAYLHNGQIDEAITYLRKAIQLKPNNSSAYNNLGIAFQERGQLDEAESNFRQAIQIEPDNLIYAENILFQMLYNSRYDAQSIYFEHIQFAKKYAGHLSLTISPHNNEKYLYRKLRIGYLSPDFRNHSVAYFIEPVLIAHDRNHFEVFCYSNVLIHDEVTKRIEGYADEWRNIVALSDEKVAELIRSDKIDILVDLAGHTINNRILLFAHKPSPIQLTWIGYPVTTGLSTMDYKIVDSYTDPPGTTEQFYTEQLIRMPESFLCYLPYEESPDISKLPALISEHVTFGSFNNFLKISPEVFELWKNILKEIPKAHLIIKAKSLSYKITRDYVMGLFTRENISPERVELLPWTSSTRNHLEIYNRIDIGLDTFPYNGTTTTCQAMWMGVPVITLAGNTHASRVGLSLLSNIGLPELVARTPDEYIDIAVNLAKDLDTLQSLRERLRDIMLHSTLTDAKRFVLNLENFYRKIFEKWCKSTRI